jgi:hypothetical protein
VRSGCFTSRLTTKTLCRHVRISLAPTSIREHIGPLTISCASQSRCRDYIAMPHLRPNRRMQQSSRLFEREAAGESVASHA